MRVYSVFIVFAVVFGISFAYSIRYEDSNVDNANDVDLGKRSTMSRLYNFLRNLKKMKPEGFEDELLNGERTYGRLNGLVFDSRMHDKSGWMVENLRRMLNEEDY